ncbi:MAG: peptide-methionine (S)-S-oxide reductase MsrA [bacterium]|nr:peptide-methionine (S)-S-oxide reductase MsrA [bacterium]
MALKNEIAIFGGGCFWCTEAIFENLAGVRSVMSGYAGGKTENPTYNKIHNGESDHVEVIQIDFNPDQIPYDDLLTVFFASHDPTTPNRQGSDIGPQYRSLILYTNDSQKLSAEKFIEKLNKSTPEGQPIITEIKPLTKFYPAEDYHQDFYRRNPEQPYCQVVINPKLEKLQKEFANLLKSHDKNHQ